MRNKCARVVSAVGISLTVAGGGLALGATANAAPAAQSSPVTQVQPAQPHNCWWVGGRPHRAWHQGWWDQRHHRWHHGWWSWDEGRGHWACRR
jgi:hypothetical protein